MGETYRIPCKPAQAEWVWPRDYTLCDLYLTDSIGDELRVTFGRYLHVDANKQQLTGHYSKSASIDVSRLRHSLYEMGTWNLWIGTGMFGGALVIAGSDTAIIVPSHGRGESWDVKCRALVAGCPTGEEFQIYRAHEDYFPKVAFAEPYSGPALPPEHVLDAVIASRLTEATLDQEYL